MNESTGGVLAHKRPAVPISLFFTLLLIECSQAQTGIYTLDGETDTENDEAYAATLTDQSAVYVLNSGNLTLNNCTMTKTGDASDVNQSSQYGINAGVLATSASKVTINGGSVTTDASGANGLFATGSGSSITMSDGVIEASGANAHGVDATYGGSITLTNVDVSTDGASASVLATDFGGGTVTVTGGTITAKATEAGSHSAGIYSTGTITVSDAIVSSFGDCGGVIDGANSIILNNTSLSGTVEGIKIWKTAPAAGAATVTIDGGSLTSTEGDGFYVTGETGNAATATLTVKNGATINAASGNIVNVKYSSVATFVADAVSLSGNLTADDASTLEITLKNGTALNGRIVNAAVTMDANSTWSLNGYSILTVFSDPGGISGLSVTNVTGNGHYIHYDSSLTENAYLGGKTYSLVNGGVLTPGEVGAVSEDYGNACILYENYPNPFKSTTTVSFLLTRKSNVSLKIYNQTGQQVACLVEGTCTAGEYVIPFSSTNFATGIYFVRLIANGCVDTQKMIIQK